MTSMLVRAAIIFLLHVVFIVFCCCSHFLWLLPWFNHFLTLNMEVELYQFQPTVSEEESSASDDSSDVLLDNVNEDRIGHVEW